MGPVRSRNPYALPADSRRTRFRRSSGQSGTPDDRRSLCGRNIGCDAGAPLDAALVHMNRADMHGNAQYLGPDLYFDDLFCLAAESVYVSCEQVVPTAELTADAHPSTIRIPRLLVSGVVHAQVVRISHPAYPTTTVTSFPTRICHCSKRSRRLATLRRPISVRLRGRLPATRRCGVRRSGGMSDATRAEVCAIACAEAYRGNGEVIASAFGVIPAIGVRLARHTFEPDLVLSDGEASAVRGTWAVDRTPAGEVESWLPSTRSSISSGMANATS